MGLRVYLQPPFFIYGVCYIETHDHQNRNLEHQLHPHSHPALKTAGGTT